MALRSSYPRISAPASRSCIQTGPPGGYFPWTDYSLSAARRSRGGEPRGQVGLQVVQRLDADRQAQQAIDQPGRGARLWRPSRHGSSTPDARPGSRRRPAIRPARRTAGRRRSAAPPACRLPARSVTMAPKPVCWRLRERHGPDASAGPGSTPARTAGCVASHSASCLRIAAMHGQARIAACAGRAA